MIVVHLVELAALVARALHRGDQGSLLLQAVVTARLQAPAALVLAALLFERGFAQLDDGLHGVRGFVNDAPATIQGVILTRVYH